ncbi:MAG: SGNH/GDSL hydrolase family protein [Clostridiales bacterium]|nr:SGNH/GDSL hydrolase family protein [Clostridiales bacterium]
MTVTKDIGFIPEDTTITLGDPIFMDVRQDPFRIYGVDKKGFFRLPPEVGKRVSPSVEIAGQTSNGGRIRFKTDSDYVVVHAKMQKPIPSFHQALSNAYGIDILIRTDGDWFTPGVCIPSQGEGKDYYEYRTKFDKTLGTKEVMLSLPLESKVESVAVALREGSRLEFAKEYKYTTPIFFYGSSITFGACASKPSNIYPAMVSRMIDTDFVNLGFGAACKAEDAMIDYIAEQKMSVFVYDYDHNAPDPDFLKKTHYRGYCRFRKKQPDTPIILASKPDHYYDIFTFDINVNNVRRKIIEETYEKALKAGDKNISFIDGRTFCPKKAYGYCFVDGCHPNDLGYYYMAKTFAKEIKKYL